MPPVRRSEPVATINVSQAGSSDGSATPHGRWETRSAARASADRADPLLLDALHTTGLASGAVSAEASGVGRGAARARRALDHLGAGDTLLRSVSAGVTR